MHEKPRIVSGVEVIPLCDAVGPMGEALRRPLDETFPGTRPRHWERMRAEQPAAFGPEGEWVLHFHCFLLRVPGGPTVLVDTGIGAEHSPAASWAPVPGALAAALEEAAVAPDDVDTVVLTHLHSDHASGAVVDGKPVFPNARHVVQEDEVRWIRREGGAVLEKIVKPLREAGALDMVKGNARLAEEIEVVPTPGHTPGHQSVMLGEDRLVVAGDVILHPVQLADPEVRYLHDEDAETAARTRAALIRRMRESGGAIAAPHLPEPFVNV
ncbi:MBL fold metallo-hydrolase [Actinomadura sp. 21ATH]|uniref:MBL fold metallo-hydrolase n=1 Tax=Actinomadura sp. 21ATH TaxID=1735444 RepID=UPI0035C1AC9E